MDNGHSVNQQHQIPTAVIQTRDRLEFRLLDNLIATLPVGNLHPVIDFQADLLAEMGFIIRVIPLDGYAFPIDKIIQTHRASKPDNLLNDLLHLTFRQRAVIQGILIPVVVEQNVRPILDQFFLSGVADDSVPPPILNELVDHSLFKCLFTFKDHGATSSYTNIPSRQAALIFFSFSSLWRYSITRE